jgi:hypothetical protein
LKQLNLLTNIKIKFLLNCVCKLEKKEVRTYERRRRLFTLVKAASYDKIYAIASKGSSKQERTAHLRSKKSKSFKKNWQKMEIFLNISKKQTKKQFVT